MQEQVTHIVQNNRYRLKLSLDRYSLAHFNSAYPPGNYILMILVYKNLSVALPEAELAFLEALATLVMLSWLLEKPGKKYCILKLSEFNFQEDL